MKTLKKTILLFFIIFLLQSCYAFCFTPLQPSDSVITTAEKSKIAVVFGTGIVDGVRLGGIYYFNNKVSIELAYSLYGWEYLFGKQIKQFSTFINYMPYDNKHFFASFCMSFREKVSTFPYELALIPGFGFSSRLNRKGLGTYIRFGYGVLIHNINFDYFSKDYIRHMGMPNIDVGIIYNF